MTLEDRINRLENLIPTLLMATPMQLEKLISYSILYNHNEEFQLPLGMTLKEAKAFIKDYFPDEEVTLVTKLFELRDTLKTQIYPLEKNRLEK